MNRFRLSILLLMLTLTLHAQKSRMSENRPEYYSAPLHFGFFLGINQTNFLITTVTNFSQVAGDSLRTILSSPETGFNLGIVSELRLHKYATLRFTPDIAFGQRNIEYNFAGRDTFDVVKKIESTFLDFPLDLKIRSKRLGNVAVYMLGGMKYTLDLASQKDTRNTIPGQEIVKLHKNDWAYQAGAGVDMFMPYFKFGIELKLSMGLRNLLVPDNTIYSNSLERLRSRVFLISFTFEG